jgi:hypothetical protein
VPRPDLATAGILAAVALLDGLRTVPAGAVVLRRFPWKTWHVAMVEGTRARLRLVGWWPPLSRSLVLPAGGAPERRGFEVAARLDRLRPWIRLLEAGGFVALIGLVLGVPLSTAWAGAWGLLGSVGALFAWALALAMVSAVVLARVGVPSRTAAGHVARLLSPFAAAGAAELVQERALAGASPVAAAESLLPAESFAVWIRPRAYDLARGRSRDPELDALHPRDHWERLVSAAPAPAGGGPAYCPRCGAWYREIAETCADCEGIALTPA